MSTDEQTALLREVLDLLRVIAEPALAERDKRRRATLAEMVGRSKPRAAAVLLMNGAKNQKTICAESGIDGGDLSRLVKSLRLNSLIGPEEKQPKLVITIPPNFFDKGIR